MRFPIRGTQRKCKLVKKISLYAETKNPLEKSGRKTVKSFLHTNALLQEGNMKKYFFVPVVLIAAFFFLSISSVHADMAPPSQPPGSLLAPGKNTTMVQMVSEKVTIQGAKVANLYYVNNPFGAVNAEVSASFFMQNQSQKGEKMQARFPLTTFTGEGDHSFNFPEIQNFRVWVNQTEKKWMITETPNSNNKDYPPIKWASFEVTFPVGKQVQVDVTYQMQSTGYLPQARFDYILETGASWFGPIDSGEIILTLPYPATNENINLSESSKDGQINGNSITWTFTNLEPTNQDNWHAAIVSSDTWQSILDLRARLGKTPDDLTLLTALAEKYESIALGKGPWMVNSGTEPIILLCREVYQKAIKLKPDDADLHIKLAGILFAIFQNPEQFKPAVPTAEDIYHELKSAYTLNPQNMLITQMYEELTRSKAVNLPPLAAEPTPVATSTPAIILTYTPAVENNDHPAATSGDNSLTYALIGIVVVLILVIIVLVNLRKKGNQ